MVTLQVRLFALMVLGTIWSCEEVVGQQSDTVAVSEPMNAFGCPKAVKIRFNKIKTRGPDSDVVYHRTTVTKERLQNSINEIVDLPSNNIGACAQAAATKGLDAFVFDGNCTGYQLGAPLFKCATDGLAIFVLPGKFAKEPTPLNLDKFPYKMVEIDGNPNIDEPKKQYMLTSFIEPQPSSRFYSETPVEDWLHFLDFLITRENGDTFTAHQVAVDIFTCLTDTDNGLSLIFPVYFSVLDHTAAYFLNECGNTIQFKKRAPHTLMLLYLHEGLGCVSNPSEVPDECTVIVGSDKAGGMEIGCYYSDPRLEDGCPGFNLTMTASSLQSNKTNTINSCSSRLDVILEAGYPTYTLSLLKHRNSNLKSSWCASDVNQLSKLRPRQDCIAAAPDPLVRLMLCAREPDVAL
ncbi:hypothetical protein FHG87_003070 [Trinorchestia longiramus]|nr:hypothetical protein FHG87_003070 [Trinorchestia longiramus]